jgi:hypothetical protein
MGFGENMLFSGNSHGRTVTSQSSYVDGGEECFSFEIVIARGRDKVSRLALA